MRTGTRTFTTIATTIALAFGVTFTVSGCVANPLEQLAKGGASEFLKGATGTDIDLGGKSIPKNFPTQIPVAEGEVEFGGSITSEGSTIWTVRIATQDPAVFTKIQSKFLSSGFEESFVTEGETPMAAYEGHGYGVLINVDNQDGAMGVTYVVSELDDDE